MTFLNQLKVILFVTFLICFDKTYAQTTLNVTGGDVAGVNGSVVYSVGQLLYTSYSGNNGTVAQGIQHPKETIITLGIDENPDITSLLTIYPNPTVDFLSLEIKNMDWQNFKYQLFDVNGRTIMDENFSSKNTLVNLRALHPAVYFLKISDGQRSLKNYKIIKTN